MDEILREKNDQYVMNTYARFPLCLSHGMGAKLYDEAGACYIDFASGIGVNSIGHGNAAFVKAVAEQAQMLAHTSNLYYTKPAIEVAERLCTRTGFAKAFFSNSGAESNEGLIKLARKYSRDKYGAGRAQIVTLEKSFHGRTVLTLSASGQDVLHTHFHPFVEGFCHVPADDFAALEQACGKETCAVMLELIQGEGGVNPLDENYVKQVAAFCKERDILLLIDEVQTGVGRCGSLFLHTQYGIVPDAISFAKGIANGMPFGGFMVGAHLAQVLVPGTHATTYGGNPIASAAAKVVLDTLDEKMLREVAEKGAYLQEKIASWNLPQVRAIRGRGLMIGLVLEGIGHRELAEQLLQNGLLALTAGSETLRLLPPLTITYEEMDAGLEILKSTLLGRA